MRNAQSTLVLHRFNAQLGPMVVCATVQGVCLFEFADRPLLQNELADLQRLLKTQIIDGENQYTRQAQSEIGEYFAGQRQTFDVALQTPGTLFQQAAWQQLHALAYGTTMSYQDQALALGQPKAVRAIAAANARNRIAIIIPCHRLIGKDGALTGYGGGLERKRWLIDHERRYACPTPAENPRQNTRLPT